MIFKFKKDYPSLRKNQFGNKFYKITLYKKIIFELLSFFGRLFSKKTVEVNDIKYLQLGCGDSDIKKNYLNLDFYKVNFFKKNGLFYHDLRYPLPFKDDTFYGVFSEHTIEHLYPSDALNLFKEVYRVLKKEGVFRIVTPDLEKYIDFYNKKFSNNHFKGFINGCEAIWYITQNFNHLSVWDSEMLELQLRNTGFKNFYKKEFNQGINKDLLIDKDGRQVESLYVEAVK